MGCVYMLMKEPELAQPPFKEAVCIVKADAHRTIPLGLYSEGKAVFHLSV